MIITDSKVVNWVSNEIFGSPQRFDEKCTALGVLKNDRLIAGVVYSDYRTRSNGDPLSIEMSVASTDKSWCTKENLRTFFSYPFTQLGLRRVQTFCSADDLKVAAFNERLGFKIEGYHRCAWHTGRDAISWSMLRNECRWI